MYALADHNMKHGSSNYLMLSKWLGALNLSLFQRSMRHQDFNSWFYPIQPYQVTFKTLGR